MYQVGREESLPVDYASEWAASQVSGSRGHPQRGTTNVVFGEAQRFATSSCRVVTEGGNNAF